MDGVEILRSFDIEGGTTYDAAYDGIPFEVEIVRDEGGYGVDLTALPIEVADALQELYPERRTREESWPSEEAALVEAKTRIAAVVARFRSRPRANKVTFTVDDMIITVLGATPQERAEFVHRMRGVLTPAAFESLMRAYEEHEDGR